MAPKAHEWDQVTVLLKKGSNIQCECKYCHHVFYGQPCRIRGHLLGDPAVGVKPCPSVPDKTKNFFNKLVLDEQAAKKKKEVRAELTAAASGGASSQPTIADAFKRAEAPDIDRAIGTFFFGNGVATHQVDSETY